MAMPDLQPPHPPRLGAACRNHYARQSSSPEERSSLPIVGPRAKTGVGRLSLLCGWDEQPSSERRERRTSILHGSSVDIGAAQDGDIMDFPVHCSQPVGPRALFRLHNHRQGLMAMEKNPLRIFLLNHRESNFFSHGDTIAFIN
jgi:hypothetical protein